MPGIPRLTFKRGAASGAADRFRSCVVVTMTEPWALVGDSLGGTVRRVGFLTGTDEASLSALERQLPPAEGVIGVGGGSSLDAAKYIAWTRGSRLLLVPTILSVDACVTTAAAVRVNDRVRYVGDITAEEVLVDYDLLRRAPPHLNRAGIGDILSIHTALEDWRSGAGLGGPAWNAGIAGDARRLLERLQASLPGIRAVTEAGMRELVELFAAETELCLRAGHSRPEEGTEHYLAYCIEHRQRRGFVHGELICLCTIVMAALQGNDADYAIRMVRDAGLRVQPVQIGLNDVDVATAILALPGYVRTEGLFPSAVTESEIDIAQAREIVEQALWRA
jgi:glycerol-1-phosphate dehydrogenase [NAD(P)+]